MKIRAEMRGDSSLVATKHATAEPLAVAVLIGELTLEFEIDPITGLVSFSDRDHHTGRSIVLGRVVGDDHHVTFHWQQQGARP